MQVAYNGITPSAAPVGIVVDPQFGPQGFFGGALGSALGGLGGGALGRALGNQNLGRQIGSVAGGVLGGLLPFEAGPQQPVYYAPYAPQSAPQGFAPQGVVVDQQLAPQSLFGNAPWARQPIGIVDNWGPQTRQNILPFEAAPVFAPQGFVGDALGAIGGPVGGWIGGRFGNAGAGQTIGSTLGGLAQRFLPFEAGPQQPVYYAPQTAAPAFAPQGFVGDALGAIGGPVGGWIGGRFGNAGAGQTIGSTLGGLAQRFLPFEAGPQQPVYYAPQAAAPVFAPQGFVGDALGAIGGPVGGWIGGRFGNAGAGQTIGSTLGGLAQRFLPFEAGPQQPVYYAPQSAAPVFAPQGFVGDALGAIGGPVGGWIGGRFGNAGAGQTIGSTLGGLAQRFLPFEAGPQQPVYYAPQSADQAFAPQGFIGDALGAIGGPVGGWIGGRFGNAGAGQAIGSTVGGLARRFLPFEAGPQQPVYYAPQGAVPYYG
ncbi:hypothetical protein V3H18_09405 [Methylocystis sp. 9N]|uniref:Uncharacterized protein n=1 Tax=Methylocystis borbori TaxID=3118750 RepID=A0ABU7XH82_9HYPH